MNFRTLSIVFIFFLLAKPVHAAHSTITEAEGSACMGEDKSQKQTIQAALTEAKRSAIEFTSTYIKSEFEENTVVKELESDIPKNKRSGKDDENVTKDAKALLAAYSNAQVKILQELEKGWYKDPELGQCYKVKIKAEITPDVKAMENMAKDAPAADDPAGPLKIKASVEKKEYKAGEKVIISLRGNKPFYARIIYKDAGGQTLQLLPNPHRTDNYFNGGTTYEIPSGNDQFELEVSPPFGEESIIVYASRSQLGDIDLEAEGGVYQVKTRSADIGNKTRGIKLSSKNGGKKAAKTGAASEFVEETVVLKTAKN